MAHISVGVVMFTVTKNNNNKAKINNKNEVI